MSVVVPAGLVAPRSQSLAKRATSVADLVVLDANPLENIRNSNTVRYVMKNGRVYDGNTLDELWPRQKKMDAVPGIPDSPQPPAGILQGGEPAGTKGKN